MKRLRGDITMELLEEKRIRLKLTKGLLDLVVLNFLSSSPMHGYGIIIAIKRKFSVYFGPSTIYPLLNAMEKAGYVASTWDVSNDRPRKIYNITKEGLRLLERTENSLNFLTSRMAIKGVEAKEVVACEVAQK
jgi:DNA-binding PadR family transcriptional regulator